MTENRVRVKDYGRLSATDPRLIPIASMPGKTCKLHYLAAAAFTAMCAACYIGTGIRLVAASGWLSDHAESFGFSPYLPEPWHWEYRISKTDWEKMP